MNFMQCPLMFMYYMMPTTLNQILTQSLVSVEMKPPKSDEILPISTLFDENQAHFKSFSVKLYPDLEGKSNITYMKLISKVNYKSLPDLKEFNKIYSGGLNRYRETYKGDEKKTNWSRQDTFVLVWLVDRYSKLNKVDIADFEEKDWVEISRMIPFRNGHDCMYKWLSLKQNRLDQHPWTKVEETFLFQLIEQQGTKKWGVISKKLYQLSGSVFRSPKQCRQHWSMYLNSLHQRCKKLWRKEQDLKLLQHYQNKGRKWKHISGSLAGRSENAIKNRFNLLMQKYCKIGWENMKESDKVEFIIQKVKQTEYDDKQDLQQSHKLQADDSHSL